MFWQLKISARHFEGSKVYNESKSPEPLNIWQLKYLSSKKASSTLLTNLFEQKLFLT